jgi:hypothetical protein
MDPQTFKLLAQLTLPVPGFEPRAYGFMLPFLQYSVVWWSGIALGEGGLWKMAFQLSSAEGTCVCKCVCVCVHTYVEALRNRGKAKWSAGPRERWAQADLRTLWSRYCRGLGQVWWVRKLRLRLQKRLDRLFSWAPGPHWLELTSELGTRTAEHDTKQKLWLSPGSLLQQALVFD